MGAARLASRGRASRDPHGFWRVDQRRHLDACRYGRAGSRARRRGYIRQWGPRQNNATAARAADFGRLHGEIGKQTARIDLLTLRE